MSESPYTAIVHVGHLFNGLNGALKKDMSLLICGDRIQAVAPTDSLYPDLPPHIDLFDFRTGYALPGLIDTHTHLSLAGDGRTYAQMFSDSDEMMVLTGAMNLKRHLAGGITTIREHGARNRVGFTLKEGLQRGYNSWAPDAGQWAPHHLYGRSFSYVQRGCRRRGRNSTIGAPLGA